MKVHVLPHHIPSLRISEGYPKGPLFYVIPAQREARSFLMGEGVDRKTLRPAECSLPNHACLVGLHDPLHLDVVIMSVEILLDLRFLNLLLVIRIPL